MARSAEDLYLICALQFYLVMFSIELYTNYCPSGAVDVLLNPKDELVISSPGTNVLLNPNVDECMVAAVPAPPSAVKTEDGSQAAALPLPQPAFKVVDENPPATVEKFPFPNQRSRRNRNQPLPFPFHSLWSRKRIRNQLLPFPFPVQQSRRLRNQLLRLPLHGLQLWRTFPNIHSYRMLTLGRGRQKS